MRFFRWLKRRWEWRRDYPNFRYDDALAKHPPQWSGGREGLNE